MGNCAECFNCRHYRLKPHDGWKPLYGGETYSHYALSLYLQNKGTILNSVGWLGTCQLSPVPAEVRSTYSCASWVCDAENAWIAPKTTAGFGRKDEAKRELAELRVQLKQERERSLERFRKLKQLQVKAGGRPPKDDGDTQAAQLKH